MNKIKAVSPSKLTGGGGFSFENNVIAYFLSCLLARTPPLDPKFGTIKKVYFQTRVDGWLLDDVLLHLEINGDLRKCALSIKSNQQFTSKGKVPEEFLNLAWVQYLADENKVFQKDTDLLGIITAPLSTVLLDAVNNLLKDAVAQKDQLYSRYLTKGFVSKLRRDVLNNFTCPEDLAKKYGVKKEDVGNFLNCIVYDSFDFESQNSSKIREGVMNCRNVLVSQNLTEANLVWSKLIEIADRYRPRSGSLDYSVLLNELKQSFQFKDCYDHIKDWSLLSEATSSELSILRDNIGGRVRVERAGLIKDIESKFKKTNIILLLGSSGCGKTILAKQFLEEKRTLSKAIWFNAKIFDKSSFIEVEKALGLTNHIQELLNCIPEKSSYIVIDAIDRQFSENVLKNVVIFIKHLENSQWKLMLTCQDQDWLQIQNKLNAYSLNSIPFIRVGELSDDEVKSVLKEFPFLKSLGFKKDLKSLLYKPKVLDLLISQKIEGNEISINQWTGESDLIDWFWNNEIRKGENASQRASFLIRLAEKQAEILQFEVPITNFPSYEPIDVLVKDEICRVEKEKVSFSHDSFSDWAKQRAIIANSNNLESYIAERVNSPIWYKAIRLFGLSLIENSETPDQWKGIFDKLSSTEGEINIAQDLLLDSLIIAADSFRVLNILWPLLKDNNGLLLNRLLRRFLHIATLPNPAIVQFFKNQNTNLATEAATYNRLVYWPYWVSMLRFLVKKSDDVKKLAPKLFLEIAIMWLRQTPQEWPHRKEVSSIVMDIAENILDIKNKEGRYAIIRDKIDEVSCKAVLAAIKETPDRVKEFVLKLCSRHSTSPIVRRTRMVEGMIYSPRDFNEIRPPWPDGPKSRVDHEFQRICLTSDALYPVIESNPILAKEIILALLIEHPSPEMTSYGTRDLLHDHLEIAFDHELYPPFYSKGPFLYFLNKAPIEGLKLIISLVNFATERWCDRYRLNNNEPPYVEFGVPNKKEYKWYGDNTVFYWYTDQQHCPDSVVSALMALEKWIYGLVDENKDIVPYINFILEGSKSLAFAGLLCAIGCKKPSLFVKELKCLFTAPEYLHWELQYSVIESPATAMIAWGFRDQTSRQLALEWHSLKHRHQLQYCAKRYLLLSDEMKRFFKDVLKSWRKRLSKFEKGSQPVLEKLIFEFNKDNYKLIDHESSKAWVLNLPLKVKIENEKALKKIEEDQLLLHLPLRCRDILNKKQTFNAQQCEDLWALVNKIKSFKKNKELEEVVVKEDALCAGVAILIRLNSDWLNKYPKRKKWCVDLIVKTILKPPLEKDDFAIEHSITDWKWHNFCADVIPIIWSEDLNSKPKRMAIAFMVLHKQLKTIEIMFFSAGEVREELGKEFKKLQNLIIKISAIRWQNEQSLRDYKKSNFQQLIKKDLNDFITGRVKSEVISLKNVVPKVSSENKYSNNEKKRFRKPFGLDIPLVLAAYKWQISLAKAKDNHERSEWIRIWKEILFVLTESFGKEDGDKEISGTPYESDRLILHQIARFVIEMQDDEHPEMFWNVILEIAELGHYWVKDFLQSFFIFGLSDLSLREKFITRWKQMLEYAFSSGKWNPQDKKYRHDLKDLWIDLMGLELLYKKYWSKEQFESLLKMESYFKKWSDAFLIDSKCMAYFVMFLKTPASEAILFNGLMWINSALVNAEDYFWRHHDVEEHLAQLLDYIWTSKADDLKQSKKDLENFNQILRILVERGNNLALALQDTIV